MGRGKGRWDQELQMAFHLGVAQPELGHAAALREARRDRLERLLLRLGQDVDLQGVIGKG